MNKKLKQLITEKKKYDAYKFQVFISDNNCKSAIEAIELRQKRKLFENAISVKEFFGVSGVYKLFNNDKLVYIGESSCIFSRIAQHIDEKIKEFTHFKYEILNERGRKKIEKILIKKYNPIYNLRDNPNVRLTQYR